MKTSRMSPDHRVGVLIVEDEHEIRGLLAVVFEIEKFKVYQAQDGIDALEVFKEHEDDIKLLITDLGLPRLGGVELIEQIRALKPSVKIIGSSGYGRSNVREEVLQAGGDIFLPKPYITKDLINTAKQLLGVV